MKPFKSIYYNKLHFYRVNNINCIEKIYAQLLKDNPKLNCFPNNCLQTQCSSYPLAVKVDTFKKRRRSHFIKGCKQ